jgi:hypothetical protein
MWGVDNSQLYSTGKRFFNESKKQGGIITKQLQQVLQLQLKCALSSDSKISAFESTEEAPTIYVSFLPAFADQLKAKGKGVIFFRQNFIIGIIGVPSNFDFSAFQKVAAGSEEAKVQTKTEVQFINKEKKSKDKIVTKDILSFTIIGKNL